MMRVARQPFNPDGRYPSFLAVLTFSPSAVNIVNFRPPDGQSG